MKQTKSDEEIILCERCGGTGIIEHSELTDYHKGEYEYTNFICGDCNGSGRLKKTIRTVTETVPYDNSGVSFLKLTDTEAK